jgi:hypothetical protein
VSSRRAALMIGAVALLALAGCGPRSAGPSSQRDDEPTSATLAQPAVAPALDIDPAALALPGRVAMRYAIAARSWTADSYRAQYRRQLRLSTGSLRSALHDAAPLREQLAAYREANARMDATVVAVTRLVESSTQARYELVLDERSAAVGQIVRQRTAYFVELQPRSGAWRVTAFSVQL